MSRITRTLAGQACPSTVPCPACVCTSPNSALMSVLLPLPLGPSNPVTPGRTVIETSESARTSRYCLLTPLISMMFDRCKARVRRMGIFISSRSLSEGYRQDPLLTLRVRIAYETTYDLSCKMLSRFGLGFTEPQRCHSSTKQGYW